MVEYQFIESRTPQAKRVPASAWEQHKAEIEALYPTMTLESLAIHMQKEYGFEPNLRQYVLQLRRWDIRKNKVIKPLHHASKTPDGASNDTPAAATTKGILSSDHVVENASNEALKPIRIRVLENSRMSTACPLPYAPPIVFEASVISDDEQNNIEPSQNNWQQMQIQADALSSEFPISQDLDESQLHAPPYAIARFGKYSLTATVKGYHQVSLGTHDMDTYNNVIILPDGRETSIVSLFNDMRNGKYDRHRDAEHWAYPLQEFHQTLKDMWGDQWLPTRSLMPGFINRRPVLDDDKSAAIAIVRYGGGYSLPGKLNITDSGLRMFMRVFLERVSPHVFDLELKPVVAEAGPPRLTLASPLQSPQFQVMRTASHRLKQLSTRLLSLRQSSKDDLPSSVMNLSSSDISMWDMSSLSDVVSSIRLSIDSSRTQASMFSTSTRRSAPMIARPPSIAKRHL